MAEYQKQFKEVTGSQNVDEQAMFFLKAFVGEFQGKFEAVLKLAEDFKSFAETADVQLGSRQELDEFQAHRFLEKRGETKTVKDMREELREIDLDSNGKVAFIEYLLFHYKKSLKDLFTAKPNSALVAKLEAAVAQYKKVFDERKAEASRKQELVRVVTGGGKEAAKAKVELERMNTKDPAETVANEMQAMQAKLAAKRALRNPQEEEDRLFQDEQARLAEEKRQQEQEEQRKRDESRQKLKERAALWK